MALMAVAYVVVRCLLTSIVGDEAMTYELHVTARIPDIILLRHTWLPANNHLLFTLLAKFSVALFGNTEWALRLPSIFALVLYCLMAGLILWRHLQGAFLFLFFAVAVYNPALLEMMSVGRGYGLGIALSVAGTYCLLRGAEPNQDQRSMWWTMATGCMAAATLANLTQVLFFAIAIAVIGAVEARAFVQRGHGALAACLKLVGPILICALVAPILGHQIDVLAHAHEFAREGKISFHKNTVIETLRYSLGALAVPAWMLALLSLSAYIVPVIGIMTVLFRDLKRNAPVATASTQADLPILLMLLVGASLLSVIQHHLLGISYLSGRRAVSFLPFFAMICGCLAGFHGYQTNLTGRILRPALAILAVVLVACFARAANLDRTMTWSYDNDTREMMSDLSSLLADRRDGSPARLGITWFLEPSINYYRVRDKVVNLAPVDRSGPIGRYDLYFLQAYPIHTPCTCSSIDGAIDPEFANAGSFTELQSSTEPLRILKRYPRTGAVLAVPGNSSLELPLP